ncbi:unnamed protein product [Cercopithifilaria johnstoni]|uniref:Uncharacterized protein n=1 Tax=Cercopithifilaria johnstoni TaxID=2874296 RepID=A0A8J2PYL6_9BILA|nr:unnamed protein product [Cercopithifilaria johnstoni]
MSLLIGAGNSNMPQPGTSFNELPIVNHNQFPESIKTTAIAITKNSNNNRNINFRYHDSNGEAIAMLTNYEAGSDDMSPQNFRPNHQNDNDMNSQEELASIPRKYEYYFMPNKSQVLFYFSDASLLRIRRAGTELQVTDSIDFPLFDIWEEVNCDKSTMILESYGRTVLLVSRSLAAGCISGNKSEPPFVAVNDWNGDLFGYFVPGDPFLIENSDKQTIAKILAAENTYGRVTAWVCVLEGSGQEMARMEEYSTIYFIKNVGGFQLKLLVLAAFARLTVSEFVRSQSCCSSFLSMLFRC